MADTVIRRVDYLVNDYHTAAVKLDRWMDMAPVGLNKAQRVKEAKFIAAYDKARDDLMEVIDGLIDALQSQNTIIGNLAKARDYDEECISYMTAKSRAAIAKATG